MICVLVGGRMFDVKKQCNIRVNKSGFIALDFERIFSNKTFVTKIFLEYYPSTLEL